MDKDQSPLVKRRGNRSKSFDVEEKANKIMDVFWDKGFWGSTLDDLLEYTSIAKQSLYNTYGDKRDMYLLALTKYSDMRISNFDDCMSKESRPLEKLLVYLENLKNNAEERRGCLMCSASLEVADRDPEIANVVEKHFKKMECRLELIVKEAQEKEEICTDIDAQLFANMLMSASHSIAMYSRLPKMKKQVANISQGTAAQLTALCTNPNHTHHGPVPSEHNAKFKPLT